MIDSHLTLLVFLRDRFEFTKRICQFFDESAYPFKVVFADGSLEDDAQNFFTTYSSKNFNFSYKRYPKDDCLYNFYTKCADAISEVDTPYVMIADNDDFPIVEGQKKAIHFLNQNGNFIGCNGQVGGITISSSPGLPYGTHILFAPQYCSTMDQPVLLQQEKALDRIQSYLTNFYSIYYAVFRTKNLKTCFESIKELNCSELGIHELFFSFNIIAQGKIHTQLATTYVRQKGSSQNAAAQKDWFWRLFHTNWLADVERALKLIATQINHYENSDLHDAENSLTELLCERMRKRFIPNQFYALKNRHLLMETYNLREMFLQRAHKLFPNFSTQLSMYGINTNKQNLRLIEQICSGGKNEKST